jgi:hypothetical protein
MELQKVKKLAKAAARRPILQCLNYKDDEITFTDSYVLIIERNSTNVEKPLVISMVTGKMYEGTYPDTSRIKPSKEELTRVDEFYLEIRPFKEPYYIADGVRFQKSKVEDALACLGLKPFGDQVIPNLFIKKQGQMLVYDNWENGQYVLILGVRID